MVQQVNAGSSPDLQLHEALCIGYLLTSAAGPAHHYTVEYSEIQDFDNSTAVRLKLSFSRWIYMAETFVPAVLTNWLALPTGTGKDAVAVGGADLDLLDDVVVSRQKPPGKTLEMLLLPAKGMATGGLRLLLTAEKPV
jgi:hypothetical protein